MDGLLLSSCIPSRRLGRGRRCPPGDEGTLPYLPGARRSSCCRGIPARVFKPREQRLARWYIIVVCTTAQDQKTSWTGQLGRIGDDR